MANAAISKSEREKALKSLIRETIVASGGMAPEAIPHRVKERLKGQAVGDADLDRLIREAIAEQKKPAR
jgi:hypothetical protein